MIKGNGRESLLPKYFILYMILSFFGWLWETMYMYFLTGYLHDRGFLTLPFCPIYATVLLGAYFLLGTISQGRGILKGVKSSVARALIYLCLSFILPTLAELIFGAFFDKVLNISLWDYSFMEFNTGGYIALEISVLWAAAIFIFMNKFFIPLKKLIFKIPEKIGYIISIALVLAVSIDLGLILIKLSI